MEYFNERLYVAVKGRGSNAIYLNSMDTVTLTWGSWVPQPGATPSSPALAASSTHLYLTVRGINNLIYWRRMDSGGSWSSWAAVPTGLTDASPAIAFFEGRLYCAVKGYGNNDIYLSSMDPVGLSWVGWSLLPAPSGATPGSPALAASADHLYLVVRGMDDRIYWRRMTTAGSWSSWTAIPTGLTDAAPAIAFFNNKLYCAVKGWGTPAIYLNSLDYGAWSGWLSQPGSSPSPTALAASPTHLYQSARGMNDRIYWRRII